MREGIERTGVMLSIAVANSPIGRHELRPRVGIGAVPRIANALLEAVIASTVSVAIAERRAARTDSCGGLNAHEMNLRDVSAPGGRSSGASGSARLLDCGGLVCSKRCLDSLLLLKCSSTAF